MFRGYVVLARRMMREAGADAEWAALMEKLASAGTEGTKFARRQLEGVERWVGLNYEL